MTKPRLLIWLPFPLIIGCVGGPGVSDPTSLRPDFGAIENPVLISPCEPGPYAYSEVFEHVMDVVDDHFVVAYSNRYDGRIVTEPRPAPGIVQFWKSGSPFARERYRASLQSIRHRADVQIRASARGGYLVEVKVFQELLDASQPLRTPAGVALFRERPTVERQFQVIEEARVDDSWIPEGRAVGLEQTILADLRRRQ